MIPLEKKVLQAVGAGLVVVFHSLYPLMSPSRLVFYHSSTDMHSVVLACVLDMLIAAAVYLLVRMLLEKRGLWRIGQFAAACMLPWMLIVLDPSLLYSTLTHLHARLAPALPEQGNYVAPDLPMATRFVILLAWVALLLLLFRLLRPAYRAVMAAGGIALAGMGVFALLAGYSLAKAWQWKPEPSKPLPMHARLPDEVHPRVVWVILDELSYDQAYGSRAADLQLPNFDALAAHSTVFAGVKPIGMWTEMVIPSLLLGERIDGVRASGTTRLLATKQQGTAEPYPTEQTLPAQAQRLGWNVGIAGWYNPYCSMLAGSYQRCAWSDRENPSGPMLTAAGLGQNMLAGFQDQMHFGVPDLGLELGRSEDETIFRMADSLLQDERLDFIFLHFPLPHPPGVWDRRKGTWAGKNDGGYVGSYADNLALADRELGRILAQLQASPRWKRTTLLVQGDHSWRVRIWRNRPSWTAEDDGSSKGGVFDDRPALIVHAPGQNAPRVENAPVSLLQAHAMLETAIRTGAPY